MPRRQAEFSHSLKHAPFRRTIAAASIPRITHVRALVEQLSDNGGRLVVPVGKRYEQILYVVERTRNRVVVRTLKGASFNFVRMTLGRPGFDS